MTNSAEKGTQETLKKQLARSDTLDQNVAQIKA